MATFAPILVDPTSSLLAVAGGIRRTKSWVDLNASDDETWYRSLERDFGLDTRPKEVALRSSHFLSSYRAFESTAACYRRV